MGIINLLDENTIDKIAAGEVVDRPASVVKELVENAMDAKATAITVEIKDGGSSLIRITDNGTGIESDDVPTAFLRHATSKIHDAMDLLSINSLGFRGEALSSIASVAQVELITKPASAADGVRYLIAGGREQSVEKIGCPDGTTIIVRNLFYNVPARKKFLKTPQTEGSHIFEIIQELALSHPGISFQYIANGTARFHTSGNGNLKDVIYNVYGRDVARNLLPIDAADTDEDISVHGFTGKPVIGRGNRSLENYFINHRYIQNKIISQAIEDAYKNFTMVHKFPFTCFEIDIDPSVIDVNVHPSKKELRLKNELQVYDFLKREIRNTLFSKDLAPVVSLGRKNIKSVPVNADKIRGPEPFEENRRNTEYSREAKEIKDNLIKDDKQSFLSPEKRQEKALTMDKLQSAEVKKAYKESLSKEFLGEKQEPPADKTRSEGIPDKASENTDKKPEASDDRMKDSLQNKPVQQEFSSIAAEQKKDEYRIIGQIFDTYWIIEYRDCMYLMDQHAAHEKVNYERLLKIYREGGQRSEYSQSVYPPVAVTLTPEENAAYRENEDLFRNFGYDVDDFGENAYLIRAVPVDIYGLDGKKLFTDMVDDVMENAHKEDRFQIWDKLATRACKASVKGGQKLSFTEAKALLDELMTLDSPFTCPHGRPTIITWTRTDIEHKFGRIQET